MAIEPVNTISSSLAAERAARILRDNTLLLQKSLLRLSSGLRIISPGDDPAGLAQSISLETQVTRISAAQSNISNATSFSETQSGFLDQVEEALDRMSELAVLSQDGLTTETDRSDYQTEFSDLQSFISDVGTKQFNGIDLFSGVDLQVTVDGDGATFNMHGLSYNNSIYSTTGGLLQAYTSSSTSVGTAAAALVAQATLAVALDNLSFFQAKVGSSIQRLSLSSETLTSLSDNLTAASELITKIDLATESTRFSRLDLLVNAGTSMVAQANIGQQNLLKLLEFD
jgi:flagellin